MKRPIEYRIKERVKEAARQETRTELRRIIQELLVERLNEGEDLKEQIAELLKDIAIGWEAEEEEKFVKELIDEITGCGPLQELLDNPNITEIMVNRFDDVWIEENGKIRKTQIRFDDDRHVLNVVGRIIEPLGRRLDESSPMVDARLPDGSRINAARTPVTIDGTAVTIRKFGKRLSMQELIELGSLSTGAAEFLNHVVRGGLNVLVTGGTGSGKTSLLNCLSAYVPADERIITIEDAAELQLQQPHVVRLETRPPNVEGKGAIGIRQLVINSLRMRPDRIVVGEVRGGEALDMLQAMNTGHEGSLTTIHANSPQDALNRLENLVMMAGEDLPHHVVREMIARAIQVIVHTDRDIDGSRKVTHIVEVQGIKDGRIDEKAVYHYDWKGVVNGKVIGELKPTGFLPEGSIKKLRLRGVSVPEGLFGKI